MSAVGMGYSLIVQVLLTLSWTRRFCQLLGQDFKIEDVAVALVKRVEIEGDPGPWRVGTSRCQASSILPNKVSPLPEATAC